MPRRRLIATAGLAGAGLGSMLMAGTLDRRRIEADPLWAELQRVPRGESMTVEGTGGTPLHAEVYGPADAPPVVLVHGWTCSLRFWRLQVHDLAADHRVVAYDLRGHGDSGAPADRDWSLDTLAADLEAVLVACVGDDRPALLAGHSLGAMTIAAWAGRYNDSVGPRAKAAALINTGLGDLISESLLLKTPERLSAGRQLIGAAVLGAGVPLPKRPDPISHRAVRAIALSPSASAAAVRYSEEMVLSCDHRVRAGCGRELSRLDLLHTVEHLNAPTLVIAGTRDRLTPPAHAHKLAEALPQSRGVLELEGSGHMSPLERPVEVNAALRQLVL
ncbi:MAG: alpha/beta hydrolase [Solirubrobacteraceae bacterium]